MEKICISFMQGDLYISCYPQLWKIPEKLFNSYRRTSTGEKEEGACVCFTVARLVKQSFNRATTVK